MFNTNADMAFQTFLDDESRRVRPGRLGLGQVSNKIVRDYLKTILLLTFPILQGLRGLSFRPNPGSFYYSGQTELGKNSFGTLLVGKSLW